MRRLIYSFLPLSFVLFACAPQTQPTAVLPDVISPTNTAVAVIQPETSQPEQQPTAAPQNPSVPSEVIMPSIESPSIVSIHMLDEAHGWALTEEKVIRTSDGGVTWQDVTPANLVGAGYFVFADFFDVDHAWLQSPDMNQYPNGGSLYRTSNGGASWESIATPFSGGSLHFTDQQNGWMLADLGVGAGSMAVSVFRTHDGGSSWERVYTNDPNLEGAGETLPLGGIKNFILPLDDGIAWVGGVIYAPGTTYLFRTDDGGRTWFNINLVLPGNTAESELNIIGIVFRSPSRGLLILRITSDTPKIIVYSTDNGGNTWSQLPASFEGFGILETPSANEMIYYSGNHFYVTTDAGQNIKDVVPNVQFDDSVIDMSFVNSQTGWVLTTNSSNERTLYKTTDGGVTWTQLVP